MASAAIQAHFYLGSPPPGMDDREVWYGMSCDEEAILKGQTRFLPRACPHGADVCAGVIHV